MLRNRDQILKYAMINHGIIYLYIKITWIGGIGQEDQRKECFEGEN